MAKVWLEFRGDEVEIDYKDHGYEPDTNAHEIDWEFVSPLPENLTDEEQDKILEKLYEISYDRQSDYGD